MNNKNILKFVKRLIENYENNSICNFEDSEKTMIYNFRYYDTNEHNRFLYLLANIPSNLDDVFIKNVKTVINIRNQFFNDKNKDFDYKGIPVSYILKNIIDNKQISLNQKYILSFFESDNVILNAPTSFGKTYLTMKYIEENVDRTAKKFLLIVPTDILETQIISKLKVNIKGISIGNNVQLNKIIVSTPEKFFYYLKNNENNLSLFHTIVIDEAHYILGNDDRCVFLKHIIEKYISLISNKTKILLISPFLLEKNLQTIKDIFKTDFTYIQVNNNTNNKFLVTKKNNEINDNFTRNDTICFYYNSTNKAVENAKKRYDLIKNIKEKNNIERYLKELNVNMDGYLLVEMMKYGICYIHSCIPDSVKEIIIKMIENNEITEIYSSPIIISGVDFPIDAIHIEKMYKEKRIMDFNDFKNLVGRSGRLSKSKESYACGFISYNENDYKNKKWFNSHKNELDNYFKNLDNNPVKLKFESEIGIDNLFVIESIKKYNELKNDIYLIDPRINYKTTDYIVNHKNIFANEVDNIFETLFINKNEEEKNKMIFTFLFLYDIKLYYKESSAFFTKNKIINIKEINSIKDIHLIYEQNANDIKDVKYVYEYIKHSMNIDKAINNKWHKINYIYKKNENNEFDKSSTTKKSSTIEKYIKRMKSECKYLFMMFISHFFSFFNCQKYTHIDDAMTYMIYDKEIFKKMHENNLLDVWVSFKQSDFFDIKKIKKINCSKNINESWKKFLINKNSNFHKFLTKYDNSLVEKINQLFSIDKTN